MMKKLSPKHYLSLKKEAVYEKIETACIITRSGDVYKYFGTMNLFILAMI